MVRIEAIKDTFNAGKVSRVANIGNAYFYCGGAAPDAIMSDAIAASAKAIESVTDWASGKKPATQAKLRALFGSRGLTCEARYDAAHGRRYKLCVYPAFDSDARRVTLAGSDGMSDTNPETARSIFQ